MKRITERLIIRNLSEEDYPSFEKIVNDVQIAVFGSQMAFLRWIISQYEALNIKQGLLSFGIFERISHQFVGIVGVGDHDDLHEPEIFYHLLPEYRQKGYATEAAKAMTDWALSHLPISYLIGTVEVSNEKSIQVLKRLGYRFIKERSLLIHATDQQKPFKIYRYDKVTEPYQCKIATLQELSRKWDLEIIENEKNKINLLLLKERNIDSYKSGYIVPYYGILQDTIICEATAILHPKNVQNGEGLVDESTAYLSNFQTKEALQGKGYFSKLFHYMIHDLSKRGYKQVTLGVEPMDEKNKEIYFHYGFTQYVKTSQEHYLDGTVLKVEYYKKSLE